MKRYWVEIVLTAFVTASVHCDAALSITEVASFYLGGGGPCWTSGLIGPLWPSPGSSNTFTLTGVSGVGVLQSGSFYVANDASPGMGDHQVYVYSLDLSRMSASGHCITLQIHFGRPLACQADVMLMTNGTSSVDVTSASLTSVGDISFIFGSGCLLPGKTATEFEMVSDTQSKHGTVAIFDSWTDSDGKSQLTVVNVPAIVPDLPPDWVYPVQLPNNFPVPYPIFQGSLNVCNEVPIAFPTNGIYKFTVQLLDGTNGFAASAPVVQDVPVVNGLFTMPLPFFPTVFMGNPLWLSMSVQPPGGGNFVPLNPPLPITPTPQAYYAYAAGVVADISPGQAVTSLNGLKDDVVLAAGIGVSIGTNGNILIINSSLGSDRNIKRGFAAVPPEQVLSKLVALPIQTWHYTNELDQVRHLGPTAQDFKAAFGLGDSETTIAVVDEGGVALSAIQGLNRKLDAEVKTKDAEIAELKSRVERLERALDQQCAIH